MSRRIVQADVKEIKQRIKQAYPDAIFRVHAAARLRRIDIDVYTDADDAWDMQKLIDQPRMNALVTKEFLISVVPQPLKYLPSAVTATEQGVAYDTQRKRRLSPASAHEPRKKYRAKKARRTSK